jgi:hypothetical protein
MLMVNWSYNMRIENGKLIYERVTCWHCEGSKVLKHYDPCPYQGKTVIYLPGRKCPHCGTKNRHNHHSLDTFKVDPCYTCEGVGTRMEDSYDSVSQELWNSWVANGTFTFEVIRVSRGSTLLEQYIGDPRALYGCIDYGRTAALSDAEILKQVPTESHPSQPVGWAPGDNVSSKLMILVKSDGYSVYQARA